MSNNAQNSRPKKVRLGLSVWEEYKSLARTLEETPTSDPKYRSLLAKKNRMEEMIVKTYEDIPIAQANKFKHTKPALLDLSDLIAAGRVGLYQAMLRYTPTKDVQFSTYATFRIRGAILDQINGVDWTPRPVRERIKKVLRAINSLEASKGSQPESGKELAEKIASQLDDDMTIDEIKATLQHLERTYFAHIDQTMFNSFVPRETTDANAQERNNLLSKKLHIVMSLILNDMEYAIIEQKFFYGFKDREIRERLNITQKQLNGNEKEALQKLAANVDLSDGFPSL